MKKYYFIYVVLSLLVCVSCQPKTTNLAIDLNPDKLTVLPEGGTFVVESAIQYFKLEGVGIKYADNVWHYSEYEREFDNEQNPNECTGMVCEFATIRKTESNYNAALEITVKKNDTGQPRSLRITVSAGDSADYVLVDQSQ